MPTKKKISCIFTKDFAHQADAIDMAIEMSWPAYFLKWNKNDQR